MGGGSLNELLDDLQRRERFTLGSLYFFYMLVSMKPTRRIAIHVCLYVDLTKRMTGPRPPGQISGYLGAGANGKLMRCSRWSSRNKREASQGGHHLSSRNLRWRYCRYKKGCAKTL